MVAATCCPIASPMSWVRLWVDAANPWKPSNINAAKRTPFPPRTQFSPSCSDANEGHPHCSARSWPEVLRRMETPRLRSLIPQNEWVQRAPPKNNRCYSAAPNESERGAGAQRHLSPMAAMRVLAPCQRASPYPYRDARWHARASTGDARGKHGASTLGRVLRGL